MKEQEKPIKLFIQTLSGERFEAEVSMDTLISSLASDFFESQKWPLQNTQGRSQRAVVERANPQNPGVNERLDGDLSIAQLDIRDGNILSIFSESIAGCFPAGTKVSLPDGGKMPIEQLKVGDFVLSYSFANNSLSQSQVVGIYRGSEKRCLLINGNLSITPSHLVRINGTWQRVVNLRIGDHLLNESCEQTEVLSIEAIDAEIEIFNLNLREENTFFVENVLVSDIDENLSSVDANFFANGFLVETQASKLMVAAPLLLAEKGFPEVQDRYSLREWWHQIPRGRGRYS